MCGLFDCRDAKLILTPIGRSRIDAGGPLTQPESPAACFTLATAHGSQAKRILESRVGAGGFEWLQAAGVLLHLSCWRPFSCWEQAR